MRRTRTGSHIALVFVVLVSVGLGGCKLPDEPGCGDSAACPVGQRCMVREDDGAGSCQPLCQRSSECSDESPLCDARDTVCRACFPGEDRLCQDRSPDTPRCDAGRCTACRPPRGEASQASECQARSAAAPICERAGAKCRPCARHDECDSGVCAKDDSAAPDGPPRGSCVPKEQVLVVDPSLCSGLGPVFCTPAQALQRVDAGHRYVLLRHSAAAADFTDLAVGSIAAHQGLSIHLIGPLADQPPQRAETTPSVVLGGVTGRDALSVQRSRVTVEGLYFRGARTAALCSGSDAELRVVRSFFAENETALSAAAGCRLSVEESWIGRGPDRGPYQGAPGNVRGIDINGGTFQIVNTVLTDNGRFLRDAFGGVRIRSLGVGRSLIVNSTLYQQEGLQKPGSKYYTAILCDVPVAAERLVLMNTLFLGDKPLLMVPDEHYVDPSCAAVLRNVGSNDPQLSEGDSVVLGMTAAPLVDAPARDLRLSMGADAAPLLKGGVTRSEVAGQAVIAPTVDADGRTRPADRIAIGAFEPASR